MSRVVVCVCVCVVAVCLASPAQAAVVYIWDGGVGNGTWHDADKASTSGAPDHLMCWAASAANSLAWTGWYGWDSGSSSLIDTADGIFDVFVDAWPDAVGWPGYGYEWWMTDRSASLVGTKTFPSTGLDFYPTVDIFTGTSVSAWVQDDSAAGNEIYTWLDNYITDDRAIVADITVSDGPGGIGAYSHTLSVWGWDTVAGKIYVTDSDDGINGLRTYDFYTSGDKVYLDDYSNSYTSTQDVLITQITRLNLNSGGLDPSRAGDGGDNGGTVDPPVVPEPSTLALLGLGVAGIIVMRRKKKLNT